MNDETKRAGKPAPEPLGSLTRFYLTFKNEWESPEPRTVVVPESKWKLPPIEGDGDISSTAMLSSAQPESIEYAIVEIAATRESVSMRELMDELKRSRPTIRKRVANLVEQGLLAPTGAMNSPQVRYRLIAR